MGARIDGSRFPDSSWSIHIDSQGGAPFFVTELMTRSGVMFTRSLSSQTNKDGKIHATFDGPTLGFGGDKLISIFVYDRGRETNTSFQDTIDLSDSGIRVDGVDPIPEFRQVNDCVGIFGNGNSFF